MPTTEQVRALAFQNRAIKETGGTTANSIFSFAVLYGTHGGSFTCEVLGYTTEPIAFPCSALTLQSALEALPSVGTGGVKVTGSRVGPWVIEFVGENAGVAFEALFVDGNELEPSQEIEVEEKSMGFSNDYSSAALQAWNDAAKAKSEWHRFLLTKRALIVLRLGELVDSVDTETGQNNRVNRKDSQRISNLEGRLRDVDNDIYAELKTLGAGAARTYGGVMKAGRVPNLRGWGR